MADNEAKWYVVHTYSGYENKVKSTIDKTVANHHLEEWIRDVRVPMQEVIEIRNNAPKQVEKKMLPGYVLINMVMNDDTWYVVRNTRGVTGFVGPGSKPVPLSDAEISALGIGEEGTEKAAAKPKIMVEYEPGDTVIVIAGAWEGTTGVITSVNAPKQKATISIELFGRETPVELSFLEIKKK